MKPVFDYRESTISYDYENKEVEFYFTRESNFAACVKRNPNYIKAEDLKPGFRVVYPLTECRKPEYLTKVNI